MLINGHVVEFSNTNLSSTFCVINEMYTTSLRGINPRSLLNIPIVLRQINLSIKILKFVTFNRLIWNEICVNLIIKC